MWSTAKAQWAMGMGAQHALDRETFGQILADRQGVQWMLADCARGLYIARLMVAGGREYVPPDPRCTLCKIPWGASLDMMQSCSEHMMTLPSAAPAAELPSTVPAGEPRASLRERKKLATRRSLRRVALDLIAERGFAHVTVEDIAEAAEVSPRTFFNYFPSKEAALFGADPDRVAALRQRVVREAPGEPVLEALRMVMVSEAQWVADELGELGGDPADWLRRMKEARTDPHLRAAHAAQMAMVERAITEGLAERLGTDPDRDPYPGLLAATAAGVLRASTTFWAGSGGTVPLGQLIDLSFRALADGLPECCALRQVTERHVTGRHVTGNVTDRKDNH